MYIRTKFPPPPLPFPRFPLFLSPAFFYFLFSIFIIFLSSPSKHLQISLPLQFHFLLLSILFSSSNPQTLDFVFFFFIFFTSKLLRCRAHKHQTTSQWSSRSRIVCRVTHRINASSISSFRFLLWSRIFCLLVTTTGSVSTIDDPFLIMMLRALLLNLL